MKTERARQLLFAQGGRYLLVGVSSAALELALFTLLNVALAVPVVASNVVAITLATTYNFLLSRAWTFRSVTSLPRSLALYLLLFVWNQSFSSAAIVLLMGMGVAALWAKLVTMACIVCWNFVLYRTVVFK